MEIVKLTKEFLQSILKEKGLKLSKSENGYVATRETHKFEKQAVTTDGQNIATPSADFEVGAEVYIIDADGNPTVAPDGQYTLDNGNVVTVVSGLATEVVEKNVEEEMSAEEVAEVVSSLTSQITDLQSTLATKETELAAANKKADDLAVDLAKAKADITKLSKAPAATSVKDDTDQGVKVELTRAEQIMENLKRQKELFGK